MKTKQTINKAIYSPGFLGNSAQNGKMEKYHISECEF